MRVQGRKNDHASTLGFAQFIAPTLTFLTGVFIFREDFPLRNLIVFGFIWSAVILYIISLRVGRKGIGKLSCLTVLSKQNYLRQ